MTKTEEIKTLSQYPLGQHQLDDAYGIPLSYWNLKGLVSQTIKKEDVVFDQAEIEIGYSNIGKGIGESWAHKEGVKCQFTIPSSRQ